MVELDFTKLYNIPFKGFAEPQTAKKPFKTPLETLFELDEYQQSLKEENVIKGLTEGLESISTLQRQADQNKAEQDRIKEAYWQQQENIIKSNQLQAEILKGARAGESVYNLFLKASKAITLMTGNTVFYSQLKDDIRAIYGEGLLQKAPLQLELQETEQRLQRLKEAQERELSGDTGKRMKNAIKAHEARIAELKELIGKTDTTTEIHNTYT